MTDIEFFENTELSDISKIRIYDDLAGQNAYFTGLTKKTVQGQYKGFTQPLLIYEPIEDAVKYAYGRFKLGTYWYYFFVTDVQQDTAGKSWISYRIDYWETTRYQFNTSLGRGTISRSSMVEECSTPYNAKYEKVIQRRLFDSTATDGLDKCDIIFFARDHSDNKNYVGYIHGPFNYREIEYLHRGTWATKISKKSTESDPFEYGDIQGAWFTPAIITDMSGYINEGWIQSHVVEEGTFVNTLIYYGSPVVLHKGTLHTTLFTAEVLNSYKTDVTKTGVIRDLEGNVVHQLDFGRSYLNDIKAELAVSPTSCKWLCSAMGSDGLTAELSFTIPCSSMDFFVDSEKEYFARDREFDIAARELNSKKNLISGTVSGAAGALGGAASGALTGAVMGSVIPGFGTGVGAVLGALGAGVSGLISSGANYGVDKYFNPQEQAIKDSYYHNALDSLSIVGSNFVNFMLLGSRNSGLWQFEMDNDTKTRLEEDIAEFGQYTSKATANGESYIADNARLKGDFIINGNVPESWKAGIQSRISTGVHIIKH